MRKAINLAAIRDDKILLVKKRSVWILPGGQPEGKETDIECLLRELSEELPRLTANSFEFYGRFTGMTPHQGDFLEAWVYLAGRCLRGYRSGRGDF